MDKRLHAHWYRDCLHVWGDVPQGAAPIPLDRATLHAALGELSADALLGSVGRPGELSLRLPAPGAPEPEPEPIVVPTLAFAPADAVDLLILLGNGTATQTSLFDPQTVPGPFVCADSVRYFARLADFALRCIAGRQFYPDLQRRSDGAFVAAWRPLVGSAADIAQLEAFAAAMPPICRAFADPADDSEPARILESFLMRATDALVRRGVADDPFFHRVQELARESFAPPEVRWLAALLGEGNVVRGSDGENVLLGEQVSAWVGRLDEARAAAAWRLCLTLREPDDEADDRWTLSFGLQNGDDESETIDAAALFREDGAGLLGRNAVNRRAQLLAELARAVELCPPLERVAGDPAPTRLEMTTIEAHLFIRQWTPALLAGEVRVFLPDWATHAQDGLGLLLSVNPHDRWDRDAPAPGDDGTAQGRTGAGFDVGSGRFGLRALMDFDWQVAVGDLRLSLEEFKRLAAANQPLVRHGGRWLRLDVDAAADAVSFLEKQSQGQMTLGDALRTAFGATRGGVGLPVLGVRGTGWVQAFLEQTAAVKLEDFAQPGSFAGTLRPYQLRGLQWLNFLDQLGIGGCLADDMGLGKTIQLIALLLRERETAPPEAPRPGPTLLFAPTSVVGNWLREVQRFAPSLAVMVHHGPDRLDGDDFVRRALAHDLVLTSYALAHRDVDVLGRVPWHRLALDEAQKIKNPAAAATVAIRALTAQRHIALTGTPVENHLSELWSIMDLLNPGLLGTAGEFRERFALPVEKLGDRQRALQLRGLIRPFVLRRAKTDPQIAGDLPQKMEMKVFCNLTPEQAGLYERIAGEMLGRIDSAAGIRRRGLILAALTRLKQVCDHPALLEEPGDDPRGARGAGRLMGRSGKAERLVEMLEELLESGDAALIFTQYRQMGHLLEKILGARLGVPMQFLHGGTPARQRDAMIERFQRPGGDVRIFLLSLRAGGLGLNLTAANHVFHFDRWWNPAVEAQATDRAYRIGQTRKVQVHKFICAGTMEERIDQLLSDKIALADRIVSSGDEWLTNLSTDQLRQYLSLSRDAVGEYES